MTLCPCSLMDKVLAETLHASCLPMEQNVVCLSRNPFQLMKRCRKYIPRGFCGAGLVITPWSQDVGVGLPSNCYLQHGCDADHEKSYPENLPTCNLFTMTVRTDSKDSAITCKVQHLQFCFHEEIDATWHAEMMMCPGWPGGKAPSRSLQTCQSIVFACAGIW